MSDHLPDNAMMPSHPGAIIREDVYRLCSVTPHCRPIGAARNPRRDAFSTITNIFKTQASQAENLTRKWGQHWTPIGGQFCAPIERMRITPPHSLSLAFDTYQAARTKA